jgi:F0F1-type ATP synthase assembly protein I
VTEPPQDKPAAWYRYTDAASIGIEIAVAVTLGTLGGMWLEHNVTHWAPWTTVIGFCIGVIAAGKAVWRTAKNYKASLKADADADAEAEAERPDA